MVAKVTKRARFARWRFAAGGVGQSYAAAIAAPCNDNDPWRRRGVLREPTRHALLCRWRVSPLTGTLECVWQTEDGGRFAGAAADADPPLSRLNTLAVRSAHADALRFTPVSMQSLLNRHTRGMVRRPPKLAWAVAPIAKCSKGCKSGVGRWVSLAG